MVSYTLYVNGTIYGKGSEDYMSQLMIDWLKFYAKPGDVSHFKVVKTIK